jgi:Icc-related predicted phosphoesterase
MKVCVISDTHELESEVHIPPCDLLIHAGDFSFFGRGVKTIQRFHDWLADQPARYRVVTAGNHDFPIAADPNGWRRRFTHAFLLLNEMVEIERVRIWASPVTSLANVAFGMPNEADRERLYSSIPALDILVTHGPPLGILDGGQGCAALRRAVVRLRPKLHCFGHVHGAYGVLHTKHTIFVNAAVLDESGAPDRQPIVLSYRGT